VGSVSVWVVLRACKTKHWTMLAILVSSSHLTDSTETEAKSGTVHLRSCTSSNGVDFLVEYEKGKQR